MNNSLKSQLKLYGTKMFKGAVYIATAIALLTLCLAWQLFTIKVGIEYGAALLLGWALMIAGILVAGWGRTFIRYLVTGYHRRAMLSYINDTLNRRVTDATARDKQYQRGIEQASKKEFAALVQLEEDRCAEARAKELALTEPETGNVEWAYGKK